MHNPVDPQANLGPAFDKMQVEGTPRKNTRSALRQPPPPGECVPGIEPQSLRSRDKDVTLEGVFSKKLDRQAEEIARINTALMNIEGRQQSMDQALIAVLDQLKLMQTQIIEYHDMQKMCHDWILEGRSRPAPGPGPITYYGPSACGPAPVFKR